MGAELGYIGNTPYGVIKDSWSSRFDYTKPSNPAIDANPTVPNAVWLNTTTGEIFHCTDNTPNNNVWVGNLTGAL